MGQNLRLLVSVALLALGSVPAHAAATDKADCDAINKVDNRQTFRINPVSQRQCVTRGVDPSADLRENKGENKGINTGGSKGFSIGAIEAPESPPGARKANASVKKEVITKTCSFPQNFKISSGGISFPKGSCFDFLNDVFKDKDGKVNSDPTPPPQPPNVCAIEADSTGLYGEKKNVSAGGTFPATCGAMLPLTSLDVVLNQNADSVAMTDEGAYYISAYRKSSGTSYAALLSNVHLPTYLCNPNGGEDGSTPVKSVDLTAPVGQAITYDPSVGEISIRLRSRASMNNTFIPPYDENEPEKFLVIPIDPASGMPIVPGDCANASTYFKVPSSREDILVKASNIEGSDSPAVIPTPVNKYFYECPVPTDTLKGTDCYDKDGKLTGPATRKDNWVLWCPPTHEHPAGEAAVSGACPANAGVPPSYQYCPDGGQLSGSNCLDPTTGTVIGPATTGSTASNTGATADMNCDSVNIYPKSPTGTPAASSCDGKAQMAVLNRPNLYYPEGSTAVLYTLAAPKTSLMAQTVANSTVYTQSQTRFLLQPTAPPLKFNEGGILRLSTKDILIMEPASVIDAGLRDVTLIGGGKLTSAGGVLKTTFAKGAHYKLPGSGILDVRVGRSVVFPAKFTYPTMPQSSTDTSSPYIRMPMDKPPS